VATSSRPISTSGRPQSAALTFRQATSSTCHGLGLVRVHDERRVTCSRPRLHRCPVRTLMIARSVRCHLPDDQSALAPYLRTTWLTPWDVTASLSWRYIGRVGLDNNDPDPTSTMLRSCLRLFRLASAVDQLLDVGATWNVWKSLEVRVGITTCSTKIPRSRLSRSPPAALRIRTQPMTNSGARYSWHSRQSSERLPERHSRPSPLDPRVQACPIVLCPSVISEVVVRGQIERAPVDIVVKFVVGLT